MKYDAKTGRRANEFKVFFWLFLLNSDPSLIKLVLIPDFSVFMMWTQRKAVKSSFFTIFKTTCRVFIRFKVV